MVMHMAIRTKQLDLYQAFLQHQQIGGRVGVPVVLAGQGHQVRAFQRICARQGLPSALVFIDLQEAFYRIVGPSLEAAKLELGDGLLHDLYEALQQPCALEAAGLPDHLARTIRALHTDTFFKLPQRTDQVLGPQSFGDASR